MVCPWDWFSCHWCPLYWLYKLIMDRNRNLAALPSSRNPEQDEQNNTNLPRLSNVLESNKPSNITEPAPSTSDSKQDGDISIELRESDQQSKQDEEIYIEKLRICEKLFDFSNENDTDEIKAQKEMKRNTLLELVDYITGATEGFTEEFVREVIKMVSINLFRKPPSHGRETKTGEFFHLGEERPNYYPAKEQLRSIESKGLEAYDLDEEDPFMEPAWVHLQIVYELFLRFIQPLRPDDEVQYDKEQFIDRKFIHNLLDLFQSEDPREREYLKMTLFRIYDNFKVHQSYIRKAINDILYQVIYDSKKHSGISELLETYGNIIDGFEAPLDDEHKSFLKHILIPLHKMNDMIAYHPQLCDCVTEFIKKDNALAKAAVNGLLKYWPKTNSSKEVLFLGELGLILENTPLEEFQTFMKPLFHKISPCFNNPSSLVAEQALSLWNEEHVKELILQNSEVIFRIISPSLLDASKNHSNPEVQELATSVKSFFNHTEKLSSKNVLQEDVDAKT